MLDAPIYAARTGTSVPTAVRAHAPTPSEDFSTYYQRQTKQFQETHRMRVAQPVNRTTRRGRREGFTSSSSTTATTTTTTKPSTNYILTFTTGQRMYVTVLGVAKRIPSSTVEASMTVMNAKDLPGGKLPEIAATVAWSDAFLQKGAEIPEKPSLTVGSDIVVGQSVGLEGSNLLVSAFTPSLSDPVPSTEYQGCYAPPASSGALTYLGGAPAKSSDHAGTFTLSACRKLAASEGYSYYMLQQVDSAQKLGYCAAAMDKAAVMAAVAPSVAVGTVVWSAKPTSTGAVGHTATLTAAGQLQILDASAAVLWTAPATTPAASTTTPGYHVTVNDDATIQIRRGAAPAATTASTTTSVAPVWSSSTSGTTGLTANAAMAADKGANKQAWMASGTVLKKGEFVGSATGAAALVFDASGQLMLYGYKNQEKCQALSASTATGVGYRVSASDANAVYATPLQGNPAMMGKLLYMDANAETMWVDASNTLYSSSNMFEIPDHASTSKIATVNLSDSAYASADSANACRALCMKDTKCGGVEFNTATKKCVGKTTDMWTPPGGGNTSWMAYDSSVDMYVKYKSPNADGNGGDPVRGMVRDVASSAVRGLQFTSTPFAVNSASSSSSDATSSSSADTITTSDGDRAKANQQVIAQQLNPQLRDGQLNVDAQNAQYHAWAALAAALAAFMTVSLLRA